MGNHCKRMGRHILERPDVRRTTAAGKSGRHPRWTAQFRGPAGPIELPTRRQGTDSHMGGAMRFGDYVVTNRPLKNLEESETTGGFLCLVAFFV